LKLFLLAALLCSSSVLAQVVRVANHSPFPFHGWKRTTIDVMPPHAAGIVGGATYVVGRPIGVDTRVVDVRVSLLPGQELAFDLATAAPSPWVRGPFPADPVGFFGGAARIDGQPFAPVALHADGAGYTLHLRRRTDPMLCVDLWCTWYPDQPGWCTGEVAMTASNPTVPDMGVVAPTGFPLEFGNAILLPLGGTPGQLLPAGATFCDGSARILPVTFVWPQHLLHEYELGSMLADAQRAIGGVGIRNLLADGNPSYPPQFSARAWADGWRSEAVRRLHTWEGAVCGPARTSSVAGRQEDQTFVRGEALLPDGVGAEWIAYFSALKLAARPCHHLEADGRPLDLAQHVNPRLVLWDGRAHWNTVLSPDQLGKPTGLSLGETKGWWGPDVEHWLMNTLAAAARLTGSPACQWLLAHQAKIYMLQSTTTQSMSTSSPFAARAVGWEGILAVHLWRELEDRALAAAVQAHWQARVTTVILPAYANKPNDIWDPRFDDARLGKGWWYHPWQQAVGAYGLDLGCAVLGPASGRTVALAAAARVLRDGFVFDGVRWNCRSAVALDGRATLDPIFYLFGTPLAPAVVLRHLPNHPQARTIFDQMRLDATDDAHFAWFAPGL
jgi:hypothetical protein